MRCLVYLPHSYTGRGPAESCIRIIESFAAEGIKPTVFVLRARATIPASIEVVEAGGRLLRPFPFRLIAPFTRNRLAKEFRRAIDAAEPGTIAYFWPNSPIGLVRYAKQKGLLCVREMINNPLARAKPILDAAYRSAGLQPSHGITDSMVAQETNELALYDYLFSSNAEVDASLRALGFPEQRILAASFGWTKTRFQIYDGPAQSGDEVGFRAVFVGLMNVRKGLSTLLEAWEIAGLEGELVLAGALEECLKPLVDRACQGEGVRHLGHVDDVASLYRSSDVFVFPTHEEGGPQVTYEAAACGVPIITTSMGAARLVDDGKTGIIVPAGDPEALAKALLKLANDAPLRARFSAASLERVEQFEYVAVGRSRAKQLMSSV